MEHDRKMTVARAADQMRDLGDRQVGLVEQRLRPLDAALQQVPMGRKPGRLSECVGEMAGTHGQRLGNIGERQVFAQIVVDVLDRPEELVVRQLRSGLFQRDARRAVMPQQMDGE